MHGHLSPARHDALSQDDRRRSGAVFSIGDMAVELGISQRAIRFYEDQGLLAPQRIGGNRVYSQRDFARLKLILRGKRLGFSLGDIKEMLDLYDADDRHLEQLKVTLAKGRQRIAELERQQQEIALTLTELREIETMLVDTITTRGGEPPAKTAHTEEMPRP